MTVRMTMIAPSTSKSCGVGFMSVSMMSAAIRNSHDEEIPLRDKVESRLPCYPYTVRPSQPDAPTFKPSPSQA